MHLIRRILGSIVAVLACALPASAQMTDAGQQGTGSSLILVWVWILIFGIAIAIIGTSLGVRSGRR